MNETRLEWMKQSEPRGPEDPHEVPIHMAWALMKVAGVTWRSGPEGCWEVLLKGTETTIRDKKRWTGKDKKRLIRISCGWAILSKKKKLDETVLNAVWKESKFEPQSKTKQKPASNWYWYQNEDKTCPSSTKMARMEMTGSDKYQNKRICCR